MTAKDDRAAIRAHAGVNFRYALVADAHGKRALVGESNSLMAMILAKNANLERKPAIYERVGRRWVLIAYEGARP